jgi:hypothetical protein
LLFGIIIIFIFVRGFVTYVTSKWKNIVLLINDNHNQIEDIKKSLDFNKLYNEFEVRLKVMESVFKMLFEKKEEKERLILE